LFRQAEQRIVEVNVVRVVLEDGSGGRQTCCKGQCSMKTHCCVEMAELSRASTLSASAVAIPNPSICVHWARARDGPTIRRHAHGSDSACLLYRPTPILMQHAAHGTIPRSCAHFICLPSQQLQQYSILFCTSMNLSVRHPWGSGCVSGPLSTSSTAGRERLAITGRTLSRQISSNGSVVAPLREAALLRLSRSNATVLLLAYLCHVE
jgi:hypothetical protein